MGKERLEEIKERVLVDRVYYKYLDGTKGHWGKTYTLNEEDYNYLKEQAKRVQELEEHLQMSNQYVKKEREINTRLKKQNKCYREHLDLIKQKSSCTMAVAYATKALESKEE